MQELKQQIAWNLASTSCLINQPTKYLQQYLTRTSIPIILSTIYQRTQICISCQLNHINNLFTYGKIVTWINTYDKETHRIKSRHQIYMETPCGKKPRATARQITMRWSNTRGESQQDGEASNPPLNFTFYWMDLVDLTLSSLLPQLPNPISQEQNGYPLFQLAVREWAYNCNFVKRPSGLNNIANSLNISIQYM